MLSAIVRPTAEPLAHGYAFEAFRRGFQALRGQHSGVWDQRFAIFFTSDRRSDPRPEPSSAQAQPRRSDPEDIGRQPGAELGGIPALPAVGDGPLLGPAAH